MLIGISLIAVGLALAGVTWWFWHESRVDNPVLGPLEAMGNLEFRQADEATRKEILRRARTTVET